MGQHVTALVFGQTCVGLKLTVGLNAELNRSIMNEADDRPLSIATSSTHADKLDITVYVGIGGAAFGLWWLTARDSFSLPAWAPWDFSWIEFLSTWLVAYWYVRGCTDLPQDERPSLPRRLLFFAGVLVFYSVVETRFEYLAEHQFFFNRIQHVAMHHLGPFLLALSWPGAAIAQGMPEPLRRLVTYPIVLRVIRVLQKPVVAVLLFSGSFFFWLMPAVHFYAMIDPRLFALMNWTMILDGVLFWFVVLDPRPSPPAAVSFGARVAMSLSVMFPQIVGGAIIAFSSRDLYPFYDLCGRIYANLGARYDQAIGGLIMWIPPAMMSVVSVICILNALRRSEETALARVDGTASAVVIDASKWTGRVAEQTWLPR